MATIMTILSAVALCLIMCLHGPTLPKHWLFDLGVPWFFFASGFWYSDKGLSVAAGGNGFGYWDQVKIRVRTLLVPYFLWNLIWLPILFTCNWIGWRYCGAQRVVDGSAVCIVRCVGLCPWAWPALVPTWYLRALFVTVVVVGGVREGLKGLAGWIVAGILWALFFSRAEWMPSGAIWEGFFDFGIPLLGCACFATGMTVRECLRGDEKSDRFENCKGFVSLIRRQMMPVYVLHAAVIVAVGWVAKATGFWDKLATISGDVVMWFVGIAGAVIVGEMLRKFTPKAAKVLFGGR